MYHHTIASADRPRRRLSLRFSEQNTPSLPQLSQPLSRQQLQRIVAEMIG